MPHPTRPRSHTPRLLAVALLLATTACTATTDTTPPANTGAPQVTGPLCAALPTGTDPGNPTFLASQPVDQALRWIPTLTTFEAALRTSGALTDLPTDTGVTILAPSDDAFAAKFSEDNWDDLMARHHDQLRTLLKAHLIAGAHSIEDLVTAGTATTLDGATVTLTRTGPTARLDDRADAVCADYQATNARIHIINAVLGPLPTTADDTDQRAH
ncbi:putative surface protein with fasciclin (FAS1) repeats [Micromonospora violae]|uniref:Putative surface protein with fasciclin (FAS1) repeats n=1 Tax=Micromonospora violae TaxID=1278207 RepID=A0A4Q7UBQ7_9ACTN|nr:fasciclin domain-containing protein [Micromonospora violae]RZT78582.1 putative surface protein with fasciclin (FAS1) repeats [Micromonospora violae]